MKTNNLNLKYKLLYDMQAASHNTMARHKGKRYFFVSLFLVLFIISAVTGCAKEDVELPTIKSWQENDPVAEKPELREEGIEVAENEPDANGVELKGVGFAVDGSYIMVSYTAPPEVAQDWWENSIYVIDEETGGVYAEIPVMPKIGPLLGKPVEAGQIGYVMLINHDFGIQSGSVVSVVLGKYKRIDIQVQ